MDKSRELQDLRNECQGKVLDFEHRLSEHDQLLKVAGAESSQARSEAAENAVKVAELGVERDQAVIMRAEMKTSHEFELKAEREQNEAVLRNTILKYQNEEAECEAEMRACKQLRETILRDERKKQKDTEIAHKAQLQQEMETHETQVMAACAKVLDTGQRRRATGRAVGKEKRLMAAEELSIWQVDLALELQKMEDEIISESLWR